MSEGMDKGGKRLKASESMSLLGEGENLEDSKFPDEEQKRPLNLTKDQIENSKKDYFNRRPAKKWERRWVLQPNVVEYGCDIWI
jgi:hypothetical protein